MTFGCDFWLESGIEELDGGLELGIGIGDWGSGIRTGDWDLISKILLSTLSVESGTWPKVVDGITFDILPTLNY